MALQAIWSPFPPLWSYFPRCHTPHWPWEVSTGNIHLWVAPWWEPSTAAAPWSSLNFQIFSWSTAGAVFPWKQMEMLLPGPVCVLGGEQDVWGEKCKVRKTISVIYIFIHVLYLGMEGKFVGFFFHLLSPFSSPKLIKHLFPSLCHPCLKQSFWWPWFSFKDPLS